MTLADSTRDAKSIIDGFCSAELVNNKEQASFAIGQEIISTGVRPCLETTVKLNFSIGSSDHPLEMAKAIQVALNKIFGDKTGCNKEVFHIDFITDASRSAPHVSIPGPSHFILSISENNLSGVVPATPASVSAFIKAHNNEIIRAIEVELAWNKPVGQSIQ